MATQVSRAQASMQGALPLFQENSCRETKLQEVVKRIQSQFNEFLGTTERILGRKIRVDLVDEKCGIVWNFGELRIKINREYFKGSTEDGLFHDILFEVQNAQYSEIFSNYFKRASDLDVETFVRLIEWTEWRTTVQTIQRLKASGFPEENLILMRSYNEDFELFFLQQQLEGHSQEIAKRYYTQCKMKQGPYRGTWPILFELGTPAQTYLKELINDHLTWIRTGEGRERLDLKIETLEKVKYAHLDRAGCTDAVANFKWFEEKFNQSRSLFEEIQS